MRYFPIFLNLQDRPCLIVGGGEVARGKARGLRGTGARVAVVAPELCAPWREWWTEAGHDDGGDDRHEWLQREFHERDVEGRALVIAATDDAAVNEAVYRAAARRNIPVNVADQPALCGFIMPSVVDRAPAQIAISTGGASPVLARLLRARLETLIPSGFGRLAAMVGGLRAEVKRRFPDAVRRRRFWERVLQGPVAEMIFAGQEKAALRAVRERLEEEGAVQARRKEGAAWRDDAEAGAATAAAEITGEVYLVGGGPGDPDLLTFRALRLMQQADVVLSDRLVAPAVLELVRRDAERIYVGKKQDRHAVPQEEINQLLIDLARAGKRVCRLKGGDPFIFGRGGEEIQELAEAGIPFQVVPGVTAAAGCAAYAGIPLTHRDHAQSCLFVTAHLKDGKPAFNWPALTQPRQTVAVYMGVSSVATLSAELLRHGMPADTPAAIVRQGATPRQKTYLATVATLPALVAENEIKPPAIIIIGTVVTLHEKLAWYERDSV